MWAVSRRIVLRGNPGSFDVGQAQRCQRVGTNVPGSILRFTPESVQIQLYSAIVERLAGREERSRQELGEVRHLLGSKERRHFQVVQLAAYLLEFPRSTKVYEMCMWMKVLDKELRPLPGQLVGFRPGMQCLDIVSFLWKVCAKLTSGEKNCSLSPCMWRALLTRSAPRVLDDVLLERGATTVSAAAAVRENLELRARPCLGFTKSASFSLDVGHETWRPKNTF